MYILLNIVLATTAAATATSRNRSLRAKKSSKHDYKKKKL
jgi:hypothetical protein